MIDALIAICTLGLTDERIQAADPPSMEFRVREFDLQGHRFAGVTHGFILLREGSVHESGRMHVVDAEGETLMVLEGYHLVGRSGPHAMLHRKDFYGFKSLMPDGTLRRAVGVPIIGGGEFVALTFRNELTHPETAERFFQTVRGTWFTSRTTEAVLAGSSPNTGIDEPKLYIREGEALTQLPQLGRYYIGDDLDFQVVHADADQIIATQITNHYDNPTERKTYMWKDGELNQLAKPAEYVTNIDGRQTKVTDWWAEVYTPDGRIVGFTACQEAVTGKQSKYYVTVWDGDEIQILPMPDEVVKLVSEGLPEEEPPLYRREYYAGLMQEVIAMDGCNVSSDAYGNIGLSVQWGIASRGSYMWDGERWHTVTSNLNVGSGPYSLTLLPKGRKAVLVTGARSRDEHPSLEVWILEF